MKRLATIFLVIFALATVAQAERFTRTAKGVRSRANKVTCTQVVQVSSQRNILYKSSNLHGGRGRTFLDQDHQCGGARRLTVAGTNKTPFACFGLYACDHPYGCRYYQALCGDGLSNTQFSSRARQNGGSSVAYVACGRKCFAFDSKLSRVGSVRK